jgi:predicted SprT family Zn-dependent metalloprotease
MKCARCKQDNRKYRMIEQDGLFEVTVYYCKHCYGALKRG